MLQYVNHDNRNIYTPVRVAELDRLLIQANYPHNKRLFLVNGFRFGFDLGYRGPTDVKLTAPNLKFTIGNETILWNTIMKEVQLKRFAGPYTNIPFANYIQSPIGLVPKDGGAKTRLIFHLSYPKDGNSSVNINTPPNLCTVEYKRFEEAVKLCLRAGIGCKAGKSDFSAAFRHLPIAIVYWRYLVMKAKNPDDKQWYYFFDKCVPFGSSRSCALFQAFSDSIAYLMTQLTNETKLELPRRLFLCGSFNIIMQFSDSHVYENLQPDQFSDITN